MNFGFFQGLFWVRFGFFQGLFVFLYTNMRKQICILQGHEYAPIDTNRIVCIAKSARGKGRRDAEDAEVAEP